MGTIVCQECGSIIDHFESDRVKTLYGICDCNCGCNHKEESES